MAGAGPGDRASLNGAGFGSGAGAGSYPDSGAAASPAMGNFTPTSGSQFQVVVIGLTDMPAGFTLNDITVNGTAMGAQQKNSDSEVQGAIAPGTTTGQIVVTYNTSETVDSSALSPSDFTVV